MRERVSYDRLLRTSQHCLPCCVFEEYSLFLKESKQFSTYTQETTKREREKWWWEKWGWLDHSPLRYSNMRYSFPSVWNAYIRLTMNGCWRRKQMTTTTQWHTQTYFDCLKDISLRLSVHGVFLTTNDRCLPGGKEKHQSTTGSVLFANLFQNFHCKYLPRVLTRTFTNLKHLRSHKKSIC